MTTSRYPMQGCSTGSQVCGEASSPFVPNPDDNAWIVNFNNGNVNANNRNNRAWARPVRGPFPAGECQGAVRGGIFRALYDAMRRAARHKVPSGNQLRFMSRWIDGLLELEQQIESGTWKPRPATCIIAQRPKAREIHAPDYSDRVAHHWLVPQLEAVFEPGFIHDSYANRKGCGTHAAVRRLQQFVRQVASGQGGGWYLQLDIKNFFNSIHRPTLYRILRDRMRRAGVPEAAQRVTHALLRSPVAAQGVIYRSTAEERARVPAHKRLENAAPGCGVAIGNLSSQFFANVYLDVLDQFVKHRLRARRYLRYVDDFVLVHHDREQLAAWQADIVRLLRDELRLELKDDIRLRPLSAGIDFLGYVVYPTHTRVRRRVVAHMHEAVAQWGAEHVTPAGMRGTPADFERIRALLASYTGHLRHADSHRLRGALARRFGWLETATRPRRFDFRAEGRVINIKARK